MKTKHRKATKRDLVGRKIVELTERGSLVLDNGKRLFFTAHETDGDTEVQLNLAWESKS